MISGHPNRLSFVPQRVEFLFTFKRERSIHFGIIHLVINYAMGFRIKSCDDAVMIGKRLGRVHRPHVFSVCSTVFQLANDRKKSTPGVQILSSESIQRKQESRG